MRKHAKLISTNRIFLLGVTVAFLALLASCAGKRIFRAGASVELEFALLQNDRFQALDKWQNYRKYLREKLWKMMGDFPVGEGPLNEKSLSKLERSGYTIEKVRFDSEPGETVSACVLVPKGIQPPFPAVICLHPAGLSKEDVIGETPQGGGRAVSAAYLQFAKRLAEKGYLAIAIDLKGAGDRMSKDRFMGQPFDWDKATAEARGEMALAQLERAAADELLRGRTWMGRTIWDIHRTIDYLMTRKDIARARTGFMGYSHKIGCMGYALGGTTAAFASIYDERIRVTVAAGGLSTFQAMGRESVQLPLGLCIPGLLGYADLPDIAAMIAPRPLLVAGGKRDAQCPADGVLKVASDANKVYLLHRSPDGFAFQLDDSSQPLSERAFQNAWVWFEKWM